MRQETALVSEPTEHEMLIDWRGVRLAGSLHLPPGGDPAPVVLMMQGSGPSDRHSNGYFLPIRETFLRRGIATFAFDKPGCGASTGDWRDHALEGRADQALGVLDALHAHPALDARRVGVWGQSQGGWLAQMIAARDSSLVFAVSNSGPSIGVEAQDLYGCEHSMRAEGRPEPEISDALSFMRSAHYEARRGTGYAEVEDKLLRYARQEPWYGYATVEDQGDWELTSRFVQEAYDPRETLARIKCPYLAIYGGLDVLVPAWQSAEETGRALREAQNDDAMVAVFPTGDHRIHDVVTGAFAAGYLDLLGDWTARRAERV